MKLFTSIFVEGLQKNWKKYCSIQNCTNCNSNPLTGLTTVILKQLSKITLCPLTKYIRLIFFFHYFPRHCFLVINEKTFDNCFFDNKTCCSLKREDKNPIQQKSILVQEQKRNKKTFILI